MSPRGAVYTCVVKISVPDSVSTNVSSAFAFPRRKDCGLGIAVHSGEGTHAAVLDAFAALADQRVDDLRAEAPLKAGDFQRMAGRGPEPTSNDPRELIATGESVDLKSSTCAVATEPRP
jgi:hypothetical protein